VTTINLICLAVFLLVSAAIFLIGSFDEKIAAELRRGKKAGTIRLRKQTLFTRLASWNGNGGGWWLRSICPLPSTGF
jgi:hypothetical protein